MTTRNKQKRLLIIVLAIVALGLGGYYLSKQNKTSPVIPAADKTANWKTYKNDSLGFELQYPSSLEVIDNTIKTQNDYAETDKKCREDGGCGGGPRPSWTFDFISVSDRQITLSVYQGISLNLLYGGKAPAGEEQYLTDYTIGGQVGLRNAQRGDLTVGQKPYLLYGVEYKEKTYTFNFLDKATRVQDSAYADKILSTFKFITPITSIDTSSWTVYTNKTFGYSLKFPATYEVPPQAEKEISQKGVDNNISVERKANPGSSVVIIDVNLNKDNMSIEDYMNKNLKLFGITGPLISYNFNGYDSLFNKNQPGTNVFIKQGRYIYHITASTASSDKEIGDILATFKFTSAVDYGPQKAATVLVQDGSYYGPPFDPNLYQLEISESEHLFAKSDLVDLKKYLGKNIKVHYREVKGVIMGEQQLIIVDSVE